MIKSIAGSAAFTVEMDRDGRAGTLNGQPFSWDLLKTAPDTFHIIRDRKCYTVFVEERQEGAYVLNVNGKRIRVEVKDKMDLLMEEMGLSKAASKVVKEVKAPMPGLVLRLIVSEGTPVKKGDSLLVLEAMKMENIIKASGDGEVGKIHVTMGQAVEKNQVLVSMK